MGGLPLHTTQHNTSAMNLAGSLCGIGALIYLAARLTFTRSISVLLGLRVPGATLANPAGIEAEAAALLRMAVNTLALAIPFLLLLQFPLHKRLSMGRSRPGSASRCFLVFWGLMLTGNLIAALFARLEGGSTPRVVLPADADALFLSWLTVCLIPALGEELLFRGLLQGWLRPYGPVSAIIGQAVVFGLLHGKLSSCAAALFGGLALGFCFERSGSLRLGMIFHLYNNSLAFITQYANQFWDEGMSLMIDAPLFFIPALAALFAVVRRKSQDASSSTKPGTLWILRCPGWLICCGILFFSDLLQSY